LADVHQKVKHDMYQYKAPRTWLRDEEAAGSNPATPTEKFQLDAMITKRGDHGIDHLLAIRWRDRTPRASDFGSEMAATASIGLGIL